MKLFVYLIILCELTFGAINRDPNSEVVLDTDNALMWQDNMQTLETKLSQPEGEKFCEKLSLNGRTDWRLPTPKEYETIVDKTNTNNYINKAFKFNVPDGYWTNYVYWRTLWFYADYMHFVSGTLYYDNKTKKKFIRCVRNLK